MDQTQPWNWNLRTPANTLPVPPGPHRDVEKPIPVEVRLEWADEGPAEWLEGEAVEWTPKVVRVHVRDPHHRLHPAAVWLRAADVRRRL